VPSRRQSVNNLSLMRTVLDPKTVLVAFMVDRMAVGEDFVRVLLFSPVTVIPPMLCTHIPFIYQCKL